MVSISTLAFCQIEQKMKREGVVVGSIYKNGKEIPGYIKKMGATSHENKAFPAPWQFQSGIRFISKDDFEKNEKIKNKLYKSYKPKDCEGYKYDDEIYETVKFADMSAVGMNMLPKTMFMRKVIDNKISVFHYYNSLPAVGVYGPGEYEELLNECAEVKYVYRIGEKGKLKLVNGLNIEKELADCPMVVEKQSRGEYKVIGKEGKSSKVGKFLQNTIARDEVRLLAIDDYNNNCE